MKKIIMVVLLFAMTLTMAVNTSANTIECYLGIKIQTDQFYASITQTGSDEIGLRLDWMLENTNTVIHGPSSTTTGHFATTCSGYMTGLSGSWRGCFYYNGVLIDGYSYWQDFNFI